MSISYGKKKVRIQSYTFSNYEYNMQLMCKTRKVKFWAKMRATAASLVLCTPCFHDVLARGERAVQHLSHLDNASC
jgi:hypothetical protein